MQTEQEQFEELIEDYATCPVPEHISTSGYNVAMINVGLVFSLLTMLTGAMFGLAIGIMNTIYVAICGSIFLVIVGTIAGMVGSRVRLSSYMLMKFSFGTKGAIIINFILAVSLLGWFGVTLDLMGDGVQGLAQQEFDVDLPKWVYMIVGGTIMTVTAIFGFKGLNAIAPWVTPILALTLAVMVYHVLEITTWQELVAFEPTGDITVGIAISAAIGSLISMMIAMPDFTRYTKTAMDSFLATFIPLLIAQPFVYVGAAMAAIAYQQDDILVIMTKSGLGVFAFLLVIMSSWISNVINLYSCSLGLSSIWLTVRKWKLEVFSGVVGTLLAVAGIMDHFIIFLELMSFIFVPAGSIYLSDFYLVKKRQYDFYKLDEVKPVSIASFITLIVGVVVFYYSELYQYTLSGLSALDTVIVTVTLYVLLKKLSNKYRNSNQLVAKNNM